MIPVDPASSFKGEIKEFYILVINNVYFSVVIPASRVWYNPRHDNTWWREGCGAYKRLATVPAVDILHRGIVPRHTKVGEWCKLSSSTLQTSAVKRCY